MIRVVLDANVYVSALIRPSGPPGQLIERFLDRATGLEIILSPGIVAEVLRALDYPKVRKYIRESVDAELWFENIVLLADLVTGDYDLPRVGADPDDEKYIAAAVEGRAAFIVTGDPHLLAVKEYEGIRIVTPRALLDLLAG